MLNSIICATKGKASATAEDKAIELAKNNNSKLIFLYVVDVGFIEKSGSAGDFAKDDVSSGLKNIGRIILDMAKEKAISKGIPLEKVLTEERKGDTISQIKKSFEENRADLVIIGNPERDIGFLERHLFHKKGAKAFIEQLKKEVGCEVMVF